MEAVKKFWPILLLGLILRVIIGSLTFHPDIRNTAISSTIILREQNLNPYDFSTNLEQSDQRKKLYSIEVTDDLPLVYWINIPIHFLLRPFVSNAVEYKFLSNIQSLFGNPALFGYLFIIKAPLILFDILLGLLLAFLVSGNLKKKILIFWMLNPVTIWATAAIGQFDIIPTFFMVLSYYLLQKKYPGWAAFSLGLSAAIKSFAFLIMPFLILTAENWKERLKLLIIFMIPWVVSVTPYLQSTAFKHNALFAPQLDKILYSKIPLSGGESMLVVPFLMILLYIIYFFRQKNSDTYFNFSSTALLLVLAFTHFHVQWFLWVMPFLILILIKQGKVFKLCITTLGLSVLLMLFLFDASLQVRLFAPIFPGLAGTDGLAEVLSADKIMFLRNLAATFFAAASVYISYKFIKFSQ